MSERALVLAIERGPNAGERLTIKDTITVGRLADNTLVIPDEELSRHHARFELRGNAVIVTDLGSANGTRVNGRPITGSQPLAPGDLVEFGDSALRVEVEGGATTQIADGPPGFPPRFGQQPSPPPAPAFGAVPNPHATQQPPPAFGSAPGGYAPPPPPPKSRNNVPLIVGIVAAVIVLCLCCGIGGLVLLSRNGNSGRTAPTATTGALFGSNGATQPSSIPRPSTQGGGTDGDTVARGQYACQTLGPTGLTAAGGLQIVSDTRVTYSPTEQPVAGTQQYSYRYDPATQAITFSGGPYNGATGAYDPTNRIIQTSPTVACVWQR